jgi:hypothetical protein
MTRKYTDTKAKALQDFTSGMESLGIIRHQYSFLVLLHDYWINHLEVASDYWGFYL